LQRLQRIFLGCRGGKKFVQIRGNWCGQSSLRPSRITHLHRSTANYTYLHFDAWHRPPPGLPCPASRPGNSRSVPLKPRPNGTQPGVIRSVGEYPGLSGSELNVRRTPASLRNLQSEIRNLNLDVPQLSEAIQNRTNIFFYFQLCRARTLRPCSHFPAT